MASPVWQRGFSKDGSTSTIACAADGKPRLGLEVTSDGEPSLTLQHKDSMRRIRLLVDDEGTVSQTMTDAKGVTRIRAAIDGVDDKGTVSQTMTDAKGVTRIRAAIDDGGIANQIIQGSDDKNKIFSMISETDRVFIGVVEKGEIRALNPPKP